MARQRDHRSTYSRRDAQARAEGFRSYADKRRHGGAAAARVSNDQDLDRLPPAARSERRKALRALAEVRTDGLTPAQAARRNETTVDSMRFWAEGALRSDGTVTRADRLLRPMRAIDRSVHTEVPVSVRGSKAASRLSAYWDAVEHYLDTGDDGPLGRFEGIRIAGIELETDTDVIDRLSLLGVLSFETIYQDVAA
jgi:hypothetical protein